VWWLLDSAIVGPPPPTAVSAADAELEQVDGNSALSSKKNEQMQSAYTVHTM
jgi:hypothetical protein